MLFLYKHPFKSVDLKEKKYGRTTQVLLNHSLGPFGHLPIKVTGAAPSPQHSFPALKMQPHPARGLRKRSPPAEWEVPSTKPRCCARFAMTPHGEKWGKTGKRNKDEKATNKSVRPFFGDPRRKKKERKKPQTRDGQWLAYQNTFGTALIHTQA